MNYIAMFVSALFVYFVGYANFTCGLKPLPPLGCKSQSAQCVCSTDSEGREYCQWVFTDCR